MKNFFEALSGCFWYGVIGALIFSGVGLALAVASFVIKFLLFIILAV